MDMKQKTAVIVAVIVVILAGVYAAQALDDKHQEARDNDQAYYFYLDGMGDSNGWYTAEGESAQDAMEKIADDANLTFIFSESGFLSISEYPGAYNSATSSGSGIGVYVYTSTDVGSPDGKYFATGPVVSKIVGNIIYVVYSDYTFDENYNAIYSTNPVTSSAWKTSGPFAEGANYELPPYDTYYFYLGGMGSSDGWYSASADSISNAFLEAMKSSGLTVTLSDSGWITIAEYPGSYDSATGTGEGVGVFSYLSNDSVPSEYYIADSNNCPVISKISSNIVFLVYSAYSFDEDWNTIYSASPVNGTAWMVGGPFPPA